MVYSILWNFADATLDEVHPINYRVGIPVISCNKRQKLHIHLCSKIVCEGGFFDMPKTGCELKKM